MSGSHHADDQSLRAGTAGGSVKSITSFSNPIIKELRGLSNRKNRQESGLFLAEGLKLVTDAVEKGWQVQTLVYAPAIEDHPVFQSTAARTRAAGGRLLQVTDALLGKITRRDNPQTVLGVFSQKIGSLKTVQPGRSGVWIALDNIKDPGNLGTIIRTADAVGADGVALLGETCDPFSMETVRATMGSIFAVPLARVAAGEFGELCSNWPGQVVATHLSATRDYREIDYSSQPTLLVMGSEKSGLEDSALPHVTAVCKIPMDGQADSLNLAIATGLMVFEVRRSALTLAPAQ